MFIEKYDGVTRINLYNGEDLVTENGIEVSSYLSGDFYFVPKVEVETNLGIDDAIASRPIQWGLAIEQGETLYKKMLFDEFTISVDNGGTVCIHPIQKGVTLEWSGDPIVVVAYLPQDNDELSFEILPVMDYRTPVDDDDDDNGGGLDLDNT